MTSPRWALILLAPWMTGMAAAADGLVWRCWYDGEVHVTCSVQQAPESHRFPYRFLHIPLHNHPTDMNMVGMLARAVACRGQVNCSANFSAEAPSLSADLGSSSAPTSR